MDLFEDGLMEEEEEEPAQSTHAETNNRISRQFTQPPATAASTATPAEAEGISTKLLISRF